MPANNVWYARRMLSRWGKRVLVLLAILLVVGAIAFVRRDRPAAEVAARWATPPSKFVEVDGMRAHVRDRGTGPALVLLHGSSSSLFTWEGFTRELGSDRRVIA